MTTRKSENTETLKFKNGKFFFTQIGNPKLRARLNASAYWKNIGDDSYETEDLGAAKAFRKLGDERVERIFKKTFQTHYELPTYYPDLSKLLDPHQVKGIEWVLTRKRSYLAHAPGAGKTAQAIIAATLAEGPGQSLFVVPPSLTKNWEREILKFTEWLDIFPTIGIISAESVKRNIIPWHADYLICSDSMISRPWVLEQLLSLRKKFIAVDEASRLKDPTSDRCVAFFSSGLFRSARHVVFLDGSPMPNRPIELWAPTYGLHPEAIDCLGYDDFGYRYCGAKPNEYGQWEYLYSSNEAELKEKLQKDFMQVVTEDTLSHPERLRSMVVMNEDVRSEEHKTWEWANIGKVERGIRFWGSEDAVDVTTGEMARFRKELGIRKIPWITKYVKDRIGEKNESILLFVWHREVANQLFAQLYKKGEVGLIIGGTAAPVREGFLKMFQEGKLKLLIMNIAAGGRGYNLQRADRVIFGEFSWTDETNKQAEKRASRKGSTKLAVRCEYIVAPNSMDEVVLRSIFSKEKRVKRIIG